MLADAAAGDHLASQLEAALSHLRRLTIDNAELRSNSKQPVRSPASAGRTQPATADRLQRQAYWRFGVAGV